MACFSRPSTPTLWDPLRVHAIVLAGGRGSRLHGLTAARAKPAVAFAGALRLVDFTLSNCLNSGLTRISVLTEYGSDSIECHLRGRWWATHAGGAQIEALRSSHPLGYRGTADAVHQHLDRLRRQGVQRVVVLAGDHVCKMDLRQLLKAHASSGAGLTVAALEVPVRAARAFGVLRADALGQVTDFEEKPARPATVPGRDDQALASMGIYAADLDVLTALLEHDADDRTSCHDFGRNILPRAAAAGLLGAHMFDTSCVRGAGLPTYWRDVGTLDSYWQAHNDLAGASPPLDLFDAAWPLRTRPCALPPSQFAPGRNAADGVAGSLVCGGCRIGAAEVHGSVLSPGVQIGAGSRVEDTVLLPGATLGRHVQLRRTIVDEGCTLPDGLAVGFDADEDAARFHVTSGGVTLVTAAMLAASARPVRERLIAGG